MSSGAVTEEGADSTSIATGEPEEKGSTTETGNDNVASEAGQAGSECKKEIHLPIL